MERGAWLLGVLLAGAAEAAEVGQELDQGFAGSGTDIVVDVGEGESIQLYRLASERDAIRIDGHLDEPVWRNMPAYDEFVVIEPDTLAAVRHETLIRLAYDDRGLYIGADMRQPVDTLIRRLSSRDDRGINRDSINVTLDTSGQGRYGFWFGINLGDSLMDGTVLPERQFTSDWDGPWRARSQETVTGWTAELFIPWSTVSMPSAGDVRRMGLYMSRKVAYLDQRWGWPGLPDTVPKFMSVLQAIEMNEVAPRQQYNFYPFVSVTDDFVEDDIRYRIGADVFWRPSTNFQLNATLNPDFGNVESDDVIINLSATETYYPEKRLFFLEGQEIFVATPRAVLQGNSLGNAGAPYTMVYTRRIGGIPREPERESNVLISDRERFQPTDLLGAAKATGQAGRLRYGVLAAFEDDLTFRATQDGTPIPIDQSGSDYGIARLLYEDNSTGAYRALGALSTAVFHPLGDALVQGIDGHYLTANGRVKLDGQLMTSDVDRADIGRGYGGFVDLEYTFRRGMQQRVGFEYFQEDFEINDLGFLQRNDEYRVRSSFILTQSNLGWARNNQLDVRGFLQNNISEGLFTGGGIFLSDRVTFRNLAAMTVRLNFLPKQYDDLNSYGNGTYRVEERAEAFAFWDSDTTRALSYWFGGGVWEEREGGISRMIETGIAWRPSDRFTFQLNVEYQDRGGWLLHQAGDLMATFDAGQWQPKVSVDYFISARQQLRLALQWVGIRAREQDFYRIPAEPDDLIPIAKPTGPGQRDSYDFSVSRFSFQARYRWEIAPLSDLFVVYTRQADQATALGDESFGEIFSEAWQEPLQNVLVLKLRYRLGS